MLSDDADIDHFSEVGKASPNLKEGGVIGYGHKEINVCLRHYLATFMDKLN